MDEGGFQQTQMGKMSWFGKHVQLAMHKANRRPITKLPMHLGNNK
jgi:hypothetical protein